MQDKTVLQHSEKDCGAACLATIAKHGGNNMTTLTNSLNKQLFQELKNEVAQQFNGGAERFRIENQVSNYSVGYNVDGTRDRLRPGYYQNWIAYSGGIVQFDKDARSGYQPSRNYNLSNGRVYAFRSNRATRNPYDIDIYRIA
jgi:hypothetical protein